MSYLHYGTTVCIDLNDDSTKVVMEQIASHASRGGWVSVTDRGNRQWHLLVSAGIPTWITQDT